MNLSNIFIKQLTVFTEKIDNIMNTLCGWVCAVWIFTLNFFAGYESAIIAVVACVTLDTIWGIAAQLKQGHFAYSELGRNGMLSKWCLYASVLIAFIHIENMAGIESHITVVLISSLICLVEIWSMSGSALIINPNMPFLRLFRRVLTGEISRKMDITPEQVEEFFKQSDNEQMQ
ncbi:MAG: phage holin family protein [Alistipes sp.]|nr:phage holin family protein [Alistipes sp.]